MDLFNGGQYLKIDMANAYGLDKLNWHERIEFIDKNEGKLLKVMKDAENPAGFYAAYLALEKAKEGKPTGHTVSFDATASGIQCLGVMASCKRTLSICNMIDTGKREDAYTSIYADMVKSTDGRMIISRADTKQAIMTAFYTSKAVPKQVFGEGEMLDTFYSTLRKMAPGAWILQEGFSAMWNSTAYDHSWVLPDNFHCKVKVMQTTKNRVEFMGETHDVFIKVNAPTKTGRSIGANATHSVDGMVNREMGARCMYDPEHIMSLRLAKRSTGTSMIRDKDNLVMVLWAHYKASGFLSARILHYMDAQNMGLVDANVIMQMINSLPKKPFKVISIHDCFRCLPNYGNDLRMQYNRIMHELGQSNILWFLVRQIMGKDIPIKKIDILGDEILNANYAIC